MKALLAGAAILALTSTPTAASPLTGQASIIDGDTIEIRGERIRLFGIDAPESTQFCLNGDGTPYRCGADAALRMASFIARRPVTCIEVDRDRYKRAVAVCSVAGVDVADWLVRQGLAMDYTRYSRGGYAAAQSEARKAKRGIWAGASVPPWEYRSCVRAGGRLLECSAPQS